MAVHAALSLVLPALQEDCLVVPFPSGEVQMRHALAGGLFL
jgi:hypothetical protein